MTVDARALPDLAAAAVGGAAIVANDEFFAPKENLIRPAPAVWDEHRYTDRGKWMDGWETRRRRSPGHDWCVVRLGIPGVIRHAVVDTAHFKGNYPASASLEGTYLPAHATPETLDAAAWVELLPRTDLAGDTENRFDLDPGPLVSHVRLNIHPDGGVARLRLHGEVLPDWAAIARAGGAVDLASLDHGGRILDASDRFFSDPANLLRPAPSTGMHDGWETRRRRDDGNDWVELALGAPGTIRELVVDTSHFKGNAPGWCAVSGRRGDGPWVELLPRVALQPHTVHRFADEVAAGDVVDRLRLDIYPDGGVARLRALGVVDPAAISGLALRRLDALPHAAAVRELMTCCGSTAWADRVAAARPFGDVSALRRAADEVWEALGRDDRLEAFAAHPRIGERHAARDTGARARRWSAGEQAGVDEGDLTALAEVNQRYEERFGWRYLICATGLDSATMLERASERLGNDEATELEVAAEEQRRITHLRITKLLGEEA